MKINQIIRQRRRELSLTQEQVAAYLGVSTPAVNKWEKGSTYPDITLLPALARLLRTDLNTLLSFQEDLSDVEIETFVDHLDQMVQEQGYQAAFQAAWDKVQEYPTCEALLYSAALYLEGALSLYPVQQPEAYQTTLESWYQRLARSDTQEIRDTAVGMLISYARNRGNSPKRRSSSKRSQIPPSTRRSSWPFSTSVRGNTSRHRGFGNTASYTGSQRSKRH